MLFSTLIKISSVISRKISKLSWRRKLAEFFVITWSLVVILFQVVKLEYFQKNYSNARISIFSFDIIIVSVAIIFWISGFIGFLKKKKFIEQLFFFWAVGIIIGCEVSGGRSDVDNVLFFIYLALFNPISFHFSLSFYKRTLRKIERYSLLSIYSIALFLCLIYLLVLVFSGFQNQAIGLLETITRVFLALTTFWSYLIHFWAYKNFSNLSDRRNIKFIMFGITTGLTPFILWMIFAQILGVSFTKVEFIFPWLIFIPITYLYSTYRIRLQFQEYRFKTLVANIFLGIIFLSSFILALQIETLIPVSGLHSKLILAFSVAIIFIFLPLRKILYQGVDWFFYGNEADYQTSVVHLEELLANILDRESLVNLLLDELAGAIKPSSIAIFLNHKEDTLTYEKGTGISEPASFHQSFSAKGYLARFLIQTSRPIAINKIQHQISWDRLTNEEKSIIEPFLKSLWIPLISENKLEGLILITRKKSKKYFSEREIQILFQISSRIGSAIRNVILAETILASQEEIIRAHYKLILAQEEERKRIARELHDNTIQQLIGVSLQVGNIINQLDLEILNEEKEKAKLKTDLGTLRTYLSDSVTDIRKMISELRPTGLDELGVCFTLENLVENIRRNSQAMNPEIILKLDPKADMLPEIYAICVYRITQEALSNIIKHAEATKISIDLRVFPEGVELEIEDNGIGFEIPKHLSELALSHHFGLIGIVERVQNLGGLVLFISQIGVGTRIKALLPQ